MTADQKLSELAGRYRAASAAANAVIVHRDRLSRDLEDAERSVNDAMHAVYAIEREWRGVLAEAAK